LSRTFIIRAVASTLTAALLVAWPVGIINAMAVGAVNLIGVREMGDTTFLWVMRPESPATDKEGS
jgi:hypothetical protein